MPATTRPGSPSHPPLPNAFLARYRARARRRGLWRLAALLAAALVALALWLL